MAIPSGSGTEVLKRSRVDGMGATEAPLLTVPSNHIYIVTTMFFMNRSTSADRTFNLYVDYDGGGSADGYILVQQSLPASATFVFDNKLILSVGTKRRSWKDAIAHLYSLRARLITSLFPSLPTTKVLGPILLPSFLFFLGSGPGIILVLPS